jgi:hypothetical protein
MCFSSIVTPSIGISVQLNTAQKLHDSQRHGGLGKKVFLASFEKQGERSSKGALGWRGRGEKSLYKVGFAGKSK